MKWYIGQDIVAIKDHSQGVFKKGDVFTIKGLKDGHDCPKCSQGIHINIGRVSELCGRVVQCGYEHGISYVADRFNWYMESCFAPLDSLVNIEELTEVLEKPIFE